MSTEHAHEPPASALPERLKRHANAAVITPRAAAERRYADLQVLAKEYDRLLAALPILAEGEPDRYQDDLWAKYVACRTSPTWRTGEEDETMPADPAFDALIELLDS